METDAARERGAAREREDRRVRSGAVAEAGRARSDDCMEVEGAGKSHAPVQRNVCTPRDAAAPQGTHCCVVNTGHHTLLNGSNRRR